MADEAEALDLIGDPIIEIPPHHDRRRVRMPGASTSVLEDGS
jgi:hypothetical protein